jgi:hypothetical protein
MSFYDGRIGKKGGLSLSSMVAPPSTAAGWRGIFSYLSKNAAVEGGATVQNAGQRGKMDRGPLF